MSWYEKGWVIFILLIVCFPLGCFLMWKCGYWHTIIKVIASVAFGFWFLCISIALFSSTPAEENPTEIVAEDTEDTQNTENTSDNEDTQPDVAGKTAEEITEMAQSDAENITEQQQQQALDFIAANCENFYQDNETMAKALYYGSFIANANYEQDKELFNFGLHIIAAIESVYDGSATTEDDDILLNLAKTKTDLIAMGLIESASIEKPSQNTTAMVEYIIYTAKANAKTASEEEKTQAIQFIKDTYPNYYTDNDIMEQTMYYGSLLEYAYENIDVTKYQLGMNTNQAVKYVYRGVETAEDAHTQENLNQIKKSLDQLFPPAQPTAETAAPATQEVMVWIPTNGGTKYHKNSTCSNMDNPTQVTRDNAVARGFSPCGRCY